MVAKGRATLPIHAGRRLGESDLGHGTSCHSSPHLPHLASDNAGKGFAATGACSAVGPRQDAMNGTLADLEALRQLANAGILPASHTEQVAVPLVAAVTPQPAGVVVLALGQGAT